MHGTRWRKIEDRRNTSCQAHRDQSARSAMRIALRCASGIAWERDVSRILRTLRHRVDEQWYDGLDLFASAVHEAEHSLFLQRPIERLMCVLKSITFTRSHRCNGYARKLSGLKPLYYSWSRCSAAVGLGVAPTPTLEPSLIDSSILTGVPCAAPCWYGLEIGRSTKADILATARTLSFIDSQGITENPSGYCDPATRADIAATMIHLDCRQPKGSPCASLLVVNDVLKEIYLFPPPSLSLGQAVTHLGPPDYVRRMSRLNSTSLCDIALIWKQRGIWISFLNESYQTSEFRCEDVHSSKDVSSHLPVEQIIYGSPDNCATSTASESGGDLPWIGFAEP
jgi:hypothetical protein